MATNIYFKIWNDVIEKGATAKCIKILYTAKNHGYTRKINPLYAWFFIHKNL